MVLASQQHFIAWQTVKAPVVLRAFSIASIVDRAPRPIAHATRQRHLFERAVPRDAIWLIGNYVSLSSARASLVGCIIVDSMERRDDIFRFVAAPQSFWLGWNDASEVILNLTLRRGVGWSGIDRDVGFAQQFQTTRQVAPDSQEKLTIFATKIAARPKLFVSYRWKASAYLMQRLLPAIERLGYSAWIDRWSGPRRFVDDGKHAPDEAVKSLLSCAIADCGIVLAVTDDHYRSSKWTSFEYDEARRVGVELREVAANTLRIGSEDEILSRLRQILPEADSLSR